MNGTRARNSALENVVKAQIPTWECFGGMSQSEGDSGALRFTKHGGFNPSAGYTSSSFAPFVM